MSRNITRRQFVSSASLITLGISSTGCGTLMYPERKGQPAGPLDWKVVALDAVGLLLFFVPGVIAFAVDFNHGTIYMPAESYGQARRHGGRRKLATVKVPREELSRSRIEQVVSEHTSRKVQLEPGSYRTEELKTVDDFWTTHDSVASVEG